MLPANMNEPINQKTSQFWAAVIFFLILGALGYALGGH
jgi:hypothetical protein